MSWWSKILVILLILEYLVFLKFILMLGLLLKFNNLEPVRNWLKKEKTFKSKWNKLCVDF